MPIVINTATGDYQILELVASVSDVGGGSLPLEGCAHLAWSPDGRRLLCTEQGTSQLAEQGLQSQIHVLDYDVSALNGNSTGVVSTPSRPLFSHKKAEALFPIAKGERCDIFHHKYAEWCVDNHHVIATIGCGLQQDEATVKLLYDRVFLIDIEDPDKPVYNDLTSAVEDATGVSRYSLTSFTATCTPSID